LLSVAFASSSCGHKRPIEKDASDVLISVGDSILTLDNVISRIPLGLSPEDSITMFNTIIDSWLEDMLLSEVASVNIPDLDRIEKMVDDYRRRLITMEYRKLVRKDGESKVKDEEVKSYYRLHSDEMRLERPVVKGIYIKISSNAEKIEDVRRWMSDASTSSIDKLEKYGLKEAMQYDYFADKWIDWQTISDQIPYRFYDPDAFVESTENFETTYNGSTYFLHIFSYLKSGEVMPFDFARDQIVEILSGNRQKEYERKLIASLYNQALKDGKLKVVGFNPVTHKMIINTKKDKK